MYVQSVMGKQSRMSKPAFVGRGVGVGKMISQLGDKYSKEMEVNKGGSRENRFMGRYVLWVKRGREDNKLGNFD